MCWKAIKSWFHREEKPWQPPHPEEPVDSAATVENTDLLPILNLWIKQWHVPEQFRPFWLDEIAYSLEQELMLFYNGQLVSPAAVTYTETEPIMMQLDVNYLNPGTIAHEAAHVSYSFLTAQQRADFRTIYTEELATRDSLVQRLYAIKKQNMMDSVEAHAECFRFLGIMLPVNLRVFYPKLYGSR